MGFRADSDGKEYACNVGDLGSIPGLGRSPGGGHGNPLQYSCLENAHGQRNLESYSPWGGKESDTVEQLSAQCMNGSAEISDVLTCNQGLIIRGKMWSFYLPS